MSDFKLKLYAVRFKDGKWYKSRGRDYAGTRLVDDINQAKWYSTPGPAKGVITYFAKNYPSYTTPDLVVVTAKEFEVIDQKDRVKEVLSKQKIKNAEIKKELKERDLKFAQWTLDQAKKELEKVIESQKGS